jgi:hypothetical protein
MSGESDGLMARIRRMRRTDSTPDVLTHLTGAPPAESGAGPLGSLEQRVSHLEQLVQGLQDSVHRETHRQERRLAELEARLDPAALAAALSKNARERGL